MSRVLLRMALRNLRLHWVRTLIVGLLLMLGTCNVVLGTGMLDAVDNGMRRSIIDSLAGHFQIYSSEAKDDLELYASIAMGMPDVGQIGEFATVKEALEALPEVEAIVPMGVNRSVVFGNTILDVKLAELRAAVRDGNAQAIEPLKQHLRQICLRMRGGLDKLDVLAGATDEGQSQRQAVERAGSEAFWASFDDDPLAALEWLDNKVAPLGIGAGLFFLTYVGTDLDAFAKQFDLFEIVDGQMPPAGQKGFLFNVNNYERFIKHKSARRFDAIKRARDEEGRRIAQDKDLQRDVERNVAQYAIVVDELNPVDAAHVAEALRQELSTDESDLSELMQGFMALTDDNFDRRYALFYDVIAPRIRLHRFKVGETLTLYSQTRSGYQRAINVKIWGTFRFKGLERSTLAGNHHLMDLITFRELYGLSNAVDPAEVEALAERSDIEVIGRDEAEDALFGGDDSLVDDAEDADFDEFAGADIAGRRAEAAARAAAGFTRADIEKGPALNAAVILKDKDAIAAGIAAVDAFIAKHGLALQTSHWRDASGIVGQLTTVMGFVFIFAIVIIFVVALVIINNSLVMSTMDRLHEIGTMRAIGVQRGFVVRMFLMEAGAMALIFGVLGAVIGALIIAALGSGGIPASTDLQYFIFGGKALHPELLPRHLLWALVTIVATTLLSTFYPALIASRVPPIAAMQAKE